MLEQYQTLPDVPVTAPTGDDVETLAPGTVLGVYRIVSLMGIGGMGIVYLAEHIRLGRKVALKMLRPEFTSNSQAVQRFFAEARAVNQIHHENIIEITDFFEDGQEKFFIMELLNGASLGEMLSVCGALTEALAVYVARQIASALAAAHAAQIIHRDLKPENIFLTQRGGRQDFVKVLDFGVAKVGGGIGGMGQTAAGAIIGTPMYMAPEQLDGTGVTAQSDIYAFGLILYEMLTGQKAVPAVSLAEAVVQHMQRPAPVLPGVYNKTLKKLVAACLEKTPAARPESMGTVLAALDQTVPTLGEVPAELTVGMVQAVARAKAQGEMPTSDTRSDGTELVERGTLLVPGRKGRGISQVPGPKPRRPMWIAAALLGALVLVAGTAALVAMLVKKEKPPAPFVVEVLNAPTQKPVSRLVRVHVTSKPSGATVTDVSRKKVLGKTPLTLKRKASRRALRLRFSLDGYSPLVQEVLVRRGAKVRAALDKTPVPVAPALDSNSASTGRPATKTPALTNTQKPPKVKNRPRHRPRKKKPTKVGSGVVDPFAG